MKLSEIRDAYSQEGLSYLDASARTCQDVILSLIAKSPLSRNVTIKGGVVMQHLSGDDRRATQDLDFDFIQYSISDDSIESFIRKLNDSSQDVQLELFGSIEELKHQDYSGKRVHIRIYDETGISIDTKLDIGVHKDLDLSQTEHCFDLGKLDDSVTLLINTKEQIVVEKLKSLLRIGAFSTRYKDVFDMYYLVNIAKVSIAQLLQGIQSSIFEDQTFREQSLRDIYTRLESVLHNKRFNDRLNNSKKNWLEVDTSEVTEGLLRYFQLLH
jgi:hypothetical protein